MNIFFNYFLLLIPLSFISCSSSKNLEFEGYFTYGHEVSAFKPCNDSKIYWLNGEDLRVIEQTSLYLANIRKRPYQKVYIKFLGFYESRDTVGFEDNYDGLIYLNKLFSYSNKNFSFCK